ncbi:hypothetical protein BDD43_4130 [Mucilaginibacter gracilis]|uniref:LTXXQ motif family protein n=1 Tax=Mucilaginibacter gracilis TaxID=423350 RepID=A0A495J4L2_9SPHI|nr:hypothetical protein [Mucilaginibacter gracilis]RKR83915.1 hypothetical protein BDD43_4130 [Mucilaginibacter gracilis]
MKKLLMVCCFVVSIVSLSKAQGGRMRRSPAEQAKEMQTQLKLTDDQTAKVLSIYTAQSTKMDSVMKAANGDRDAMRSAMQPLRKEANDKILAVLTDDQKVAYKKMEEERMSRMRNGGGGNPPPPPSQK